MKKLIPVALLSVLLSACGSAPKKEPVSGALQNQQQTSVRFQAEPARTSIQFNTQGYTLFGAIYVAAAVAKMNEQTEQLNKAYAELRANNPQLKSFEQTFNEELSRLLQAEGVQINPIEAERLAVEDQTVNYKITSNPVKTPTAIILDGLNVQYHAISSTHDYTPRVGLLVSVVDTSQGESKVVKQETIEWVNRSFGYQDYEAIENDIEQSYQRLHDSTLTLARQVADILLGRADAASLANP
jgi:hypothetical protein